MESDYLDALKGIYPNHSEDTIVNIIELILEEESELDYYGKLQRMANLLSDAQNETISISSEDDFEESNEGAFGTVNPSSQNFETLINLYPDVSEQYLRNLCTQEPNYTIDQLLDFINNDNHIQRKQRTADQIWEALKQMLPNADPIYLRNNARVLVTRPTEELENFVQEKVENNDYPTMQEYLKEKNKLSFYYDSFNVESFLNEVPDALTMFKSDHASQQLEGVDLQFALYFLYQQFPLLHQRQIDRLYDKFNHNLSRTSLRLRSVSKVWRQPRRALSSEEPRSKNVQLLQEVLFLRNERHIRLFVKRKDEMYKCMHAEAEKYGLLETCKTCYDDTLIPDECFPCAGGCVFCKECVRRGAEVVIGRGEFAFACFINCGAEFDLGTLRMVLDRKTFERMFQRRQADEVSKANVAGLETCSRCDFSMIPNADDLVFKCENVECMAETCRKCMHPSHIPLRCNEVEYEEDVRMRTYIENKMTEALLRVCWKCNTKFLKSSGCNKMTCKCGAHMCYVCGAAIKGYDHFGEIAQNKCPLHTNNLDDMHLKRVLAGAEAAKAELGVNRDPKKLKFDPTRGLV